MAEINFFNVDCIEFMKSKPDKCYDLAIVDPPYGIGDVFIPVSTGAKPCKIERKHKIMDWDNEIPTQEYFKELKRVSKNQIIWGANYFNCFDNGGALVWYKNNGAPSLSQCEIASLSFKKSVDYVYIQVLGGFVQKNKPIHPTQKPIKLYRWMLNNYAKSGYKILDTHGGSFTHAIACDMEGFDLDICEIDKEYFDKGKKQFYIHKLQSVIKF